jgi:hypothetical protein
LAEVVLAEHFTGTTTTGIIGLHTNIPKAITILAAIGNPEIHSTHQAGSTLGIGIAITLSLGARTFCITEARITMVTAHAAAAVAANIAGVVRFIASLAGLTGAAAMIATAIGTGVGTITVATIVTG